MIQLNHIKLLMFDLCDLKKWQYHVIQFIILSNLSQAYMIDIDLTW